MVMMKTLMMSYIFIVLITPLRCMVTARGVVVMMVEVVIFRI
jgi:hypothetical protein